MLVLCRGTRSLQTLEHPAIECTQASTVALSRLAPDMMADSDYFLRLANASLLLQIGWVTSTRLFTLHNLGENPESADEFSHKSTCFIWEESSKEWTMEACHFSMSLAQSARLFRSVVHTEDGEPEDTVVSLTYENGITEFRSGRSLVQNYVARPFSMPLAGPSSADLAPDMKNAKAIALSPNGLLGIALLDNQDDILGGTFFSLFETKLGLDSEPLLERLCKSTVVGLLNGYDCYDNILVLVQLQQEILRDQGTCEDMHGLIVATYCPEFVHGRY
ncbi:uncharacterized protein BJ171DRAFT_72681 [Polychytrium aggregatum]|uniref:uncharacterized protein n=1 Tax=Polychytrium aggregatum TaxID=110093 RepID=UPI0022FE8B77|nr:uncharacterized protein BJ171DRAFT_72681 [Polychytrium aggregatum]KAI9205368.1 hypothetical protein BJ171DRAFT_72681 [Polychytrium aggregatum]